MEFIRSLIIEHTPVQAIVVLAAICAAGLVLGKIRVWGVSLGVTFVFFVGILAGHVGLSIDGQVLAYAQNFGLVLFVYSLGLQVGPGFFSSFRKGGMRLNLLGLALVVAGTAFAVVLSRVTPVSLPDMVGLLCGAATNTPALGAAQQTLSQMHLPSESLALGCAVAYPLGVVGVILAILLMRRLFVRDHEIASPDAAHTNETFIATFRVTNPGVFGMDIPHFAHISGTQFVITRLWRNGTVFIPASDTRLEEGDRVLLTTSRHNVATLVALFGEQESTDWNKDDVDWNSIDNRLISQRIIITRPEINGKRLGSLRLRNNYGINISRIYRSDVPLLATPDLVLQLGDRVTVVGDAPAVHKVEAVLGNAEQDLNEPHLASLFMGLVLGLALGAVPIFLPGMTMPVKLGLAGGPIVVGLLVGAFGPRMRILTYTTRSANLMLRALGLAIYLACLGLAAGAHFFETVFRPEGLLWIALGASLAIVPVLVVGLLALKVARLDFGTVCGMLCGSMANPMALSYANDTIPGDNPSVAYATVYPLSMFSRVIITQIILMFFL